MKISKLFHLLYFAVLCLPILAIPIFGIYAHRHTIDNYIVNVDEVKSVDFNQLLNNSDYEYQLAGLDINCVNNTYIIDGTSNASWQVLRSFVVSYDLGHKYYLYSKPYDGGIGNNIYLQVDIDGTYYTSPSVFNFDGAQNYITTALQVGNSGVTYDNKSYYFGIYDLTQMFGAGNEPTIEQFSSWFPNNFYQYTLSNKQLLYTGNTITYDDNDIGSQLIYTSYNVVNKYFNYDGVFNFGALYDWLQINFFVGNAPLGFFIFWHLLIYWLLTSLLWLLFDVLIYVPMVIHKWLDKASM